MFLSFAKFVAGSNFLYLLRTRCWNLHDIKYINMWMYHPHIWILIVLLQSLFSSFHIHLRTIYIVEQDLFLSLSCFTINTTEVRYSLPFYSYILNLHLLQSLVQVFNNISHFMINMTELLVQAPIYGNSQQYISHVYFYIVLQFGNQCRTLP